MPGAENCPSLYDRLKDNPDYRNVACDPATGAVKAIHVRHEIKDPEKDRNFFGGMTTTDLEIECMDILFNLGHTAILREEGTWGGNRQLPEIDLLLDGRLVEIRAITTPRMQYGNQLDAKNDHLRRYNQRDDILQTADTICLYFHDPSYFSEEAVIKSIDWFKNCTTRTKDGSVPILYFKSVIAVVCGHPRIYEFSAQ